MNGSRVLMLAATLVLGIGSCSLSAYGDDERAENKELQRINREMREKKKEIKRVDRKERSILSALDRIDRDIQAGATELSDQRRRLRESETGLLEVEQSNAEISRALTRLKHIYGQRLRALYKMTRSGNAAVLATESLGSVIKRVKYVGIIAERDHTVMRKYSSALDQLAAQQAEIAEKKEDILSRKRTIEIKKIDLEARRRKKADLLASVRKEKGLYEQTLRELEESSASLWAMVKRSEQEKKTAKQTTSSSGMGSSLHAKGTRLPWPVEGQVLSQFGMQRHPRFGTMVFRRGIEIEAREGGEVRAVSDGQIAYADWYKGYGKLIILDHGNDFYTLYGNLSRLDMNRGDRVAKGQVIGLAGDTGSMKGSKLYFEIRRKGEAQDPLAWLTKR